METIRRIFGRARTARVVAVSPFAFLFSVSFAGAIPLWVPLAYVSFAMASYFYYVKVRYPMMQREAACQMIFGAVTCPHGVYRAAKSCEPCDKQFVAKVHQANEAALKPANSAPDGSVLH